MNYGRLCITTINNVLLRISSASYPSWLLESQLKIYARLLRDLAGLSNCASTPCTNHVGRKPLLIRVCVAQVARQPIDYFCSPSGATLSFEDHAADVPIE